MARPLDAILETALYASDLDAAFAFYGETLGLELVSDARPRHVFFRLGTQMLLIFYPARTETPGGPPGLPVPTHGARGPGHVCFTVARDDLDGWRTRLAEAGTGIEADFEWPNGARSLYFRDPAGNSLEMAEPKLWFGA
ncbi:VOC family protein [Oceanomicrobium pacificus]|uniref:Glyoxalase/bleomycin resistance/extradiol dioxygenase family protein n=1 Tax=Oceanomicrobium pacificus TaxID=2692916 RepID=A0A6B0TMV9_9RHOB|nr:VOC family protein [Oceanomicrobium pacificus]MXU65930.1 glyoxalase/bleomycin resistance/extradiol dioxygenase family protein [Oceanomicrobium pacificus]